MASVSRGRSKQTENVVVETAVIESAKKKRRLHISPTFVLFVLFVAASGVAAYFYIQYKNSDPNRKAQVELDQVKKAVGKIMELPDEAPTLATIMDKTKLENSPFFSKAENGDKVLLFTNTKKAILYRPSTGKIVDITAINVTDNNVSVTSDATQAHPADQTPVPAPQASAPVTPPTNDLAGVSAATPDTGTVSQTSVALYNGSTKIGVTNTLESEIVAKFPLVVVEKKEKAAKSDYTETEVIDLSGKNADLVAKVAEAIGGKIVSALPDGEINPGTDILVIVGQKL